MTDTSQKIRCEAKSKRTGKRCQRPAVTGYSVCYMHGANPQNHGGAPKGNKNAITYGIFSNDLQDEEEKRFYQEYYQALQKDFELNSSSDRKTCQMACMFFIRLRRAINNGKTGDIALMESMVRNQLKDLKATRDKREGDTVDLKTSPAEWAATILKEVEEARQAKAGKKKKTKPLVDKSKTV